ncbi:MULTISPECIES: hypothetical protein [unclassified Vibrio]|uniref:DNA polymerase III subunit beta n=1 Tax=Vibrio sp. HB236076 TaxID=3232307 RepID=A0AB39HGB4_9VIBR|nr:hypothetical protein [Vibrio sp. HB161653]MDP5254571.1 hypothetical protein [Vibrio sp. HB161653]
MPSKLSSKVIKVGTLLAVCAWLGACSPTRPLVDPSPSTPSGESVWQGADQIQLGQSQISLNSTFWYDTLPVIGEVGITSHHDIEGELGLVSSQDIATELGVTVIRIQQGENQWTLSKPHYFLNRALPYRWVIEVHWPWLAGFDLDRQFNLAVEIAYQDQRYWLVNHGVKLALIH